MDWGLLYEFHSADITVFLISHPTVSLADIWRNWKFCEGCIKTNEGYSTLKEFMDKAKIELVFIIYIFCILLCITSMILEPSPWQINRLVMILIKSIKLYTWSSTYDLCDLTTTKTSPTSTQEHGRAIAQAVSRRLSTAAARFQTQVWSCGILWWTKVALRQVFSENFGFPCQSTFHMLLHNHLHYHPRLAQ
jgi:hypothetical protein